MRRFKRRSMALLCCLWISLLVTGCSAEKLQSHLDRLPIVGSGNVFRMNEMRCPEEEARLYLYTYSALYGDAYGLDLWQMEFPEQSLQEYVKNLAMTELTQIYCIDLLAKQTGIALEESEYEKAAEAAEKYLSGLPEDAGSYIGIEAEQLTECFAHYALAHKTFDALAASVDREISDDEARVMKVQQIVLDSSEDADDAREKLEKGTDFSTLLGSNTAKETDVHAVRDTYPSEITEVIYHMQDEEVSPVMYADGKWYIIKVLDMYEEDRTEEYKSVILEERRKALFHESYDPYMEQVIFQMDDELWEGFEVPKADSGHEDFFEVYADVFGRE